MYNLIWYEVVKSPLTLYPSDGVQYSEDKYHKCHSEPFFILFLISIYVKKIPNSGKQMTIETSRVCFGKKVWENSYNDSQPSWQNNQDSKAMGF